MRPLVVLLAAALPAAALDFGPAVPVPAQQGQTPGLVWGDFDADGQLELLASGYVNAGNALTVRQALTRIDDGSLFFVDLPDLPLVVGQSAGPLAAGDFNGDGHLDFAFCDFGSAPTSVQLVLNTPGGPFMFSAAGLPLLDLLPGQVLAVADVDQDGDLDVVAGGHRMLDGTARVVLAVNDGTALFTPHPLAGLPAELGTITALDAADFDGDGDSDLRVAGLRGDNALPISRLFLHQPDGSLAPAAALPMADNATLLPADFDGDGDTDFAVQEPQNLEEYRPVLLRQDGPAGFTRLTNNLPDLARGPLYWADADADGGLELWIGGQAPPAGPHVPATGYPVTAAGAGAATVAVTGEFPALLSGHVLAADATGDGRVDFLFSGHRRLGEVTEPTTTFWPGGTNNPANIPPGAPSGLSASVGGGEVILNWSPAADANQTNGLTYNLRVGTAPGRGDVLPPHADAATGRRLIAAPGNAGTRLTHTLRLPAGEYFWSVQAVDAGLAGGPFAAEGSFTTAESRPVLRRVGAALAQLGSASLSGEVNPGALPGAWWFELTTDLPDAATNVITGDALAATNAFLPVELLASGLTTNVNHRAWLVASNALGLVRSPAVDFYVFNQPPVVRLTNAAAAVPGAPLSIPFTVADPDGPLTNLVLSTEIRTEQGQVQPVTHAVITGEGTNRVLEVTLKPGVFGLGRVIVRAVDLDGEGAVGGAFVRVTADYFGAGRPLRQDRFAVADFNEDGRLDLFSPRRAQVWLQDAEGWFPGALCDVMQQDFLGEAAVGDFTGDGHVDALRLLDVSASRSWTSLLWRNDAAWAAGCSLTAISTNLPRIVDPAYAAADADNDGDLDFLVGGLVETSRPAEPVRLLLNDGAGGFTPRTNLFPALHLPVIAWGDYDGDGDADLLLAGLTNRNTAHPVTHLYRNDGELNFTAQPQALPGFWQGSADWGDFDRDGDLDLAITGCTNRGPTWNQLALQFYRNDAGQLTLLTNFAAGRVTSKMSWADADGDGDLDLFVAGYDRNFNTSVNLYLQEAPGRFANTGMAGRFGARGFAVADFDRDGDLDYAAGGFDSQGELRLNQLNRSNAPPAAPSNLRVRTDGGGILFEWDAATDAEQSGGLTYNLHVGTTPGRQDVVSAMADPATGLRRIAARGNADTTLFWRWKLPRAGRFYWSVQAVDHGFAGGPFAAEQTFTVADLPPVVLSVALREAASTAAWVTGTLRNHGEPTTWWFEWGTTTNYGAATAPRLAAGTNGPATVNAVLPELPANSALHARLVVSNRFGVTASADFAFATPAWAPFTPLMTLLPQFGRGGAAWADFDEDDDLDLATLPLATNAFPALYRNQGGWLAGEALMQGYATGASGPRWADWDADGDLDLFMFAFPRFGTAATNILGRNLGGRRMDFILFRDAAPPPGLTPLRRYADGDWHDFDGDGREDAIEVTSTPQAWIHLALGRERFRIVTPQPGPILNRPQWADLNGDDHPDLVGWVQGGTPVWLGTAGGQFHLAATLTNLLPVPGRDSFWHDWDGDGDVDALLTDLAPTPDRVRLLLNDGRGKFGDDMLGSTAINGSLLGAADLDADGRLDLVTALTTNLIVWTRPDGTNFVPETLKVAGTDNPGFALADFDGDHRPDFFFTAQRELTTNRITAVFRNNFPGTNTPPGTPANLVAAVGTNEVAFAWDAAVDKNQAGGLTYNVYVGTAPGRQDVLAAHSNQATGFRRQPQPGNNGLRRTRHLVNLYPGTYWWSVQAVDAAFAGGAFAAEQSFVIPTNQTPQVEFAWPPGGEATAVTGLAGWLTLETSPDLQTWTAYRTNHFPAGTNAVAIGVSGDAPEAFFRGRLEPR